VALLVGWGEYDMGNRHAAETTRQAALSLGVEAGHGELVAWAHEVRAWINLTTDDCHGVVAAARSGTQVTPHQNVAVRLFAQEAMAWARMGDRRQTEVALDKGRRLLDNLPYLENLDHHFVVDPAKFDFYAMDCNRTIGANEMAEHLAEEVIETNTDFDGQERAPMRMAEARLTVAVVRARDGAVNQGSAGVRDPQRRGGPSRPSQCDRASRRRRQAKVAVSDALICVKLRRWLMPRRRWRLWSRARRRTAESSG
jgi:hypothetical protein